MAARPPSLTRAMSAGRGVGSDVRAGHAASPPPPPVSLPGECDRLGMLVWAVHYCTNSKERWMRKWTGHATHSALGVLFVAVLSPGIAADCTARVLTSVPAALPDHVTGARRVLDTGPGQLRLRGGGGGGGLGGRGGAMWIMVHGEESDAVTLAWEKVDGAQCYEVQLKTGDKPDAEFATLSDKLSSTMVSVRAMPLTWLQRRHARGVFAVASCVCARTHAHHTHTPTS
jgi:hypothetical protein